MSRDDETGAVAAAEYFLTDLYEYTLAAQEVAAWEAMSHPDCIYCSAVVDSVEQEMAHERVTIPGDSRATLVRTERLNPLAFGVMLDVDAEADRLRSQSGTLLDTGEPFRDEYEVVVVRQGSDWKIRGVDFASAISGEQ